MKTKLLLVLVALSFICPIFGQSGTAKRVAILETVDKEGKVSYGVKLMVRSKLSAVITATPGYEGYDRVDVSSILGEHEFQRTGLVSDSDIKRLGEITGADYILVAEVAFINDSYIFLSAKILNVETARVEQTANTQTEATVAALEQNCKVLAGKLLNVNVETGAVRGELIIYGHRYVGEHKNGKPHGRGVIFYDDINYKSYEGDWYYGKREGKGTLILQNGSRYEGEWKNDEPHGTGTMIWEDGEKYVGEWRNGNRDGHGIFYYDNGDRYDGGWLNDKKSGHGTYYWASGNKEVANYANGVLNGLATYYLENGDYEKRTYKDDNKEGPYTYYFADGHKRVGTYVNGKREGSATYYFNSGNYVKENWVADKQHGPEYWYRPNGYKYKTCIYDNGVLKSEKYNK